MIKHVLRSKNHHATILSFLLFIKKHLARIDMKDPNLHKDFHFFKKLALEDQTFTKINDQVPTRSLHKKRIHFQSKKNSEIAHLETIHQSIISEEKHMLQEIKHLLSEIHKLESWAIKTSHFKQSLKEEGLLTKLYLLKHEFLHIHNGF